MNLKKLAPWNWFKSEEPEQETGHYLATGNGDGRSPLLRLHREIDRLFDENLSFDGPGFNRLRPFGGLALAEGFLKPTMDISESDKNYTIKVEVPGVDKEDIQIDVRDDILVIRGEKKHEDERKDEHFHRIERSYGSFQRVLNLPPDAVGDSTKARFRNGVLTLTVARTAGAESGQSRAVKIG